MNKTIGILGGTFDPVHNGHLHLAQTALQVFGLKQVVLIPTNSPPHKARPDITSGKHRLKMLELAVEDNPDLTINLLEFERGGTSYTIDTLRSLTEKDPDLRPRLIMGADMLSELHLWKDCRQVIALGKPIIATRPGTNIMKKDIKKLIHRSLYQHEKVLLDGIFQLTPLDISSTEIRSRLRLNQDIAEMLPQTVANYIAENELYKTV